MDWLAIIAKKECSKVSDKQIEKIRWSIIAITALIVIIVTQFFGWEIWDAQIFVIIGFLSGEIWRLYNYLQNRKKSKKSENA